MILLDTCTLLWLVAGDDTLSTNAKNMITKNEQGLFVSAISAFEIGVKVKKKKLKLPKTLSKWYQLALELHNITEIPVSSEIAILSTELEQLHNDPADRLIIATASLNHLTILTPDKLIKGYKQCQTLW